MTAPVMTAVERYIAMRHGLGYRSPTQERSLRAFARHLDAADHSGPIWLDSSLEWATATTSTDPCNPARRLATVRGFLRHLSALDGATDVPAPGLLGSTGARKPPHVYTDDEITALLRAAAWLDPIGGLRPRCYVTLFGLLACTGLRISEACGLRVADVDFTRGVVHPVQQHGGRPLKTAGSCAPIPIPRDLALLLAASVHRYPSQWMVTRGDGEPCPPRAVERAVRSAHEKVADLPEGFTFHDLRHYLASLLIASGADIKTIQARMRHAPRRQRFRLISSGS